MLTVFISSQRIDHRPVKKLIGRLRAEGWTVDHSPRNPVDGDDPRWPTWYEQGLPDAVAAADVFVITLEAGWDSATWMAVEASEALEHRADVPTYYWNPENLEIRAKGMAQYLRHRLPNSLDELVEKLRVHERRNSNRPNAAGDGSATSRKLVQK